VANTRRYRAERKPPGRQRDPQARLRPRERIAAEQAARQTRRGAPAAPGADRVSHRRPRYHRGAVAVKLTSANPTASESPAPSSVVSQVTTVPAAVLTRVSAGQAATPLLTVKTPALR